MDFGDVLMVGVVLGSGGLVLAGASWLESRTPGRQVLSAVLGALVFGLSLLVRPSSLVVSDAIVLVAAIALAPLLGNSLGSLGAIIAFVVTVSVVDILSFGGGLTRQIIQDFHSDSGNLLQFLAFTIRMEGRAVPLVGIADLAVLGALHLGLVRVHGRVLRAALVLLAALALATLAGLLIGGVAALPFLGVAAALDAWLANRRREQA